LLAKPLANKLYITSLHRIPTLTRKILHSEINLRCLMF